MKTTVRGLVLREVNYRDSDKMLTILTAERGRVSAAARGARGKNSQIKAGTQLLTCSDFTFFEQQGRFTVDAAEPVEFFLGLRSDIVLLSLGTYICEVLEMVSGEDIRSGALLSDGLNCMYALSRKLRSPEIVKAAFELRTAAIVGFAPDVTECGVCGDVAPQHPALDIAHGMLTCAACNPSAHPLDPPSLAAIRYLLSATSGRMFGFSLDGGSVDTLARAAENYMLTHLDQRFSTLEFYKKLL